jgi:hypothetical protein
MEDHHWGGQGWNSAVELQEEDTLRSKEHLLLNVPS